MMDLAPMLTHELPWVRWAAMAWAQQRPSDDSELQQAHTATLAHPLIRAQLDAVLQQPWMAMKNHKAAKHPLHRLGLLVDLGLTGDDPEGAHVAERITEHQTEDGPFQVISVLPKAFGGSGRPEWLWMACDAPPMLEAAAALGLAADPQVQRAATHLVAGVRESGWPCSSQNGISGPGRKADPCPYATLLALRALSRLPEHRDSPAAHQGTEMLLGHWTIRAERKIRMFGIGTDYAKPKYPLIWYDLLHLLEVLSRFEWTHSDPRFVEQLELLRSLAQPDESYKPASVWMAFKGFDFCQKRQASPTLGLAVERIEGRVRGSPA